MKHCFLVVLTVVMLILSIFPTSIDALKPTIVEFSVECQGEKKSFYQIEETLITLECASSIVSVSLTVKTSEPFILKLSGEHVMIKNIIGAELREVSRNVYQVNPRGSLVSIDVKLVGISDTFLQVFTKELDALLTASRRMSQRESVKTTRDMMEVDALLKAIEERLENSQLPLSAKLEYRSRLLDLILKKGGEDKLREEAEKLLAAIATEEKIFKDITVKVAELYREVYGSVGKGSRERILEAFNKLQEVESYLYDRKYEAARQLIAEVETLLHPTTLELLIEILEKAMPFLLLVIILVTLVIILRVLFTKRRSSRNVVESGGRGGSIPPWLTSFTGLPLIFKEFLEVIIQFIRDIYSFLYTLSCEIVRSIAPLSTTTLIEATTLLLIATLTALVTGISRKLTIILLSLAWTIIILYALLA